MHINDRRRYRGRQQGNDNVSNSVAKDFCGTTPEIGGFLALRSKKDELASIFTYHNAQLHANEAYSRDSDYDYLIRFKSMMSTLKITGDDHIFVSKKC